MIRKVFMLIVVFILFLYIFWNFYSEAWKYDPLYESNIKKVKPKDTETVYVKYTPAWSDDIHDNNLFSTFRSYVEPKPVSSVPVPPPPKRPEMILKGIIIDTFGDYVAYLEIDKSKPISLRKGDKIEDIEIIDISERKVVLKWNAETINLSIEKIKTISSPRTMR